MVDIPFVVCQRKTVHSCEKCGLEMVLPDEEDRCYECPNCKTQFCTEHNEAGELIVVLTPIDNTKVEQ